MYDDGGLSSMMVSVFMEYNAKQLVKKVIFKKNQGMKGSLVALIFVYIQYFAY